MVLAIDDTLVEGLTDTSRFRMVTAVQATAATTFTFSTATGGGVIFTGTVAGQIVSLGNATTYSVGQEFWVYNDSTQTIAIRDSSAVLLYTLPLEGRVKAVLRDNSTTAGVWTLTSYVKSTAAVGSTAIAFFADTTNNVSNKFLSTQNINVSDIQPAVMPASSTIRVVTFCGSNIAPTGTIEFRVNTTVGPAAISCTLTTTTNTQVFSGFSLTVNAGDQLNCKVAAGASGIGKPVVLCYF